jgi:Zn-finger nucleic acid-binding protein
MNDCSRCGAPLLIATRPATCGYCGTVNTAAPREAPIVRVVQVVSTAPGAPTGPLCPHCRQGLVSITVSETELHGCGRCGGIWLENAAARRVMESPDRVFADLATRAACSALAQQRREDAPAPVRRAGAPCPICSAPLALTGFIDLALDVCRPHGTWFDPRELASLVALLEARAARNAVPRVACARCRAAVPADQTNVSEAGTVCDPCYAELRRRELGVEAADSIEGSGLMQLHKALYARPG